MRTGTVAIIAALVIASAIASGPAAFAQDSEPLLAPVCPADLNADSIVDRADLERLLRFYGVCKGCEEDLNDDNFVDDSDVAIMTREWGPCRPEGDVFGGDHSGGSLVPGSDSLTDEADSFADGADSLVDESGSFADAADSLAGDANSLSGRYEERATTTLVEPRCDGDLNGDNIVDRHDVNQMLDSFGPCRRCDEDLNGDGSVDEMDMRILMADWGWCPVVTQLDQAVRGASQTIYTRPEENSIDDSAETFGNSDDTLVPEDVNGDGFVDMVDILTVAEHVGQRPTGDKAFSDVNNDGRIDERDIKAIAEYAIAGDSIGG